MLPWNKINKNQLHNVFKNYPVEFVYLFGSYNKDNTSRLSDIDIAAYFQNQIIVSSQYQIRSKLMVSLEPVFKTENIDIIILNNAYPLIKHRIIKEGNLIYSVNEKARINFEVNSIMCYLDYKPYIEMHTKDILNGR